jgi:hypothetical protein
MNEHVLERIRDLERSVRRWRLACLAMAFIIVSLIAIGGTVGIMAMIDSPSQRQVLMLQMQEIQAREQAERALAAERAARQQLEQQKQRAQPEQPEP